MMLIQAQIEQFVPHSLIGVLLASARDYTRRDGCVPAPAPTLENQCPIHLPRVLLACGEW